MSEYQYYEFQAVDRPLDAAEQAALGALSTRARITATGFVNHYEWGDFKGDPRRLMEDYFDLFVYLGRMCQFKACPAGKTACLVPGCGATPFLQQHEGFVLEPDALEPARTVRLFVRATGEIRRAADLPGPLEDEIH